MFKRTIMIIIGSLILFTGSSEISNFKLNDYTSIEGVSTNDFPDQH